jgi:putative acetyltransferase
MALDDYEPVLALWHEAEGMGLSRADTREKIGRYLERNPEMSLVAFSVEGELAGAVLCGHDGRRGFLHHLAVRVRFRGQGLGRAMVERCMGKLAADGIDKCHLFVYARNQSGREFWKCTGWNERPELVLMSKDTHVP